MATKKPSPAPTPRTKIVIKNPDLKKKLQGVDLSKKIVEEGAKRKPGRPAGPNEKQARSLNLDAEVWDKLEEISEDEDISLSTAANNTLRKALKI